VLVGAAELAVDVVFLLLEVVVVFLVEVVCLVEDVVVTASFTASRVEILPEALLALEVVLAVVLMLVVLVVALSEVLDLLVVGTTCPEDAAVLTDGRGECGWYALRKHG
jgi:hypothetical protein